VAGADLKIPVLSPEIQALMFFLLCFFIFNRFTLAACGDR